MQVTLRTKETYEKYTKLIAEGFLANGCNLCKKTKTLKEFEHWRIVDNLFPWDNIAEKHDMIIPKRHIVFEELNDLEKKEYEKIKIEYIEKEYELIAEATNKKKTIPEHMHIHLIILKK